MFGVGKGQDLTYGGEPNGRTKLLIGQEKVKRKRTYFNSNSFAYFPQTAMRKRSENTDPIKSYKKYIPQDQTLFLTIIDISL